MLTFLELYQTLLGFVFFKLYADAGLVYPPPRDAAKDDSGAGVGAFRLQESTSQLASSSKTKEVEVNGKRVSTKDVRQTIKSIGISSAEGDAGAELPAADSAAPEEDEEEFVPHPSTSDPDEAATLPTLRTLAALPQSGTSKLFAPYTFWLSRETSRPIFEFIVRSFGGRIGWPESSGSGSPFDEADDSVTHVIIDRPLVEKPNETEEEKERRRRRKYVQPQWVVDCINAGKILLEEPYFQGKTLPPHLSPFGDLAGAYDPTAAPAGEDVEMEDEEEDVGEDAMMDDDDDEDAEDDRPEKAVLKAAAEAEDEAALRAAELAAEAAGVDYGTFEKSAKKSAKKAAEVPAAVDDKAEQEMNKMMMSNKQRKLYERMKYGEKKRATEVSTSHRSGLPLLSGCRRNKISSRRSVSSKRRNANDQKASLSGRNCAGLSQCPYPLQLVLCPHVCIYLRISSSRSLYPVIEKHLSGICSKRTMFTSKSTSNNIRERSGSLGGARQHSTRLRAREQFRHNHAAM